jgi:signal transduction histidine kinase
MRVLRRLAIQFLLILLWGMGVTGAWGQVAAPVIPVPVLEVADVPNGMVSLTQYLGALEDARHAWSLPDVMAGPLAQQFQYVGATSGGLDFGFSRSARWLRLSVHNAGSERVQRMIEIAWTPIAQVSFFAPDAQGVFVETRTGSEQVFSTRAFPNRNFVFPIEVPAHTRQDVYLRLQGKANLLVPATLWEPSAFHQHVRNDYLTQAWYLGVATAMLAFNLLLFVTLGDRVYLLYVTFVACLAMGVAGINGMTKEFLWPNATGWTDLSIHVSFTFAGMLWLLFTRRMLNTAQFAPRLDALMKWYLLVYALLLVALLMDYQSATLPAVVTYVCGVSILFSAAIYGVYRRQPGATWFLTAFTTLLLATYVMALWHFGVLPTHPLTTNALVIGSSIEMLVLAFALADRYRLILIERAKAQSQALAAQHQLVETLKGSERVLEERVAQRTDELLISNRSLEATLLDLRTTQTQLIQSEKLASLGQLVANVAHEINTPIGAIKSSGETIDAALDQVLSELPVLLVILTSSDRALFMQLIACGRSGEPMRSAREERALTRDLTQDLQAHDVPKAQAKASLMVRLNAQRQWQALLPLLVHEQADLVLAAAHRVASIVESASNIQLAVERVSKIVFALRSFSRQDDSEQHVALDAREGIETVLVMYQHQLRQGVEVVREFGDVPKVMGQPDTLNQVWTNLIQNALQAMNRRGRLTLGMRRQEACVVVSVSDTGSGIPQDILDKIFMPFFTTKPVGEGSGLGLDIVKKIIERHKGRIEVRSTVGVGTQFEVYLPMAEAQYDADSP